MSHLRCFCILLLAPAIALAQTNTFPTSGNVGIGTTSPGTDLLHLYYGASGGLAYNAGGLVVESSGRSSIQLLSPNSADSYLFFGDASSANKGYVGQTGSTASPANMMHYYSVGGHAFTGSNVGIGTTGPTSIAGVSRFLDISGTTASVVLHSTSASKTWEMFNDGPGLLRFYSLGHGDTMALDQSGNVGIGTTEPTQRLTVNGGALNVTTGGTLTASSATNGLNLGYDNNSEHSWIQSTREDTSHLRALALNPLGGNVGIGTTSPSQKLSVNGTIRAKEVIVDTGWSDYVFDADYKLKALSETEAYIQAEHHLPGIPSSQEIAEHGVSMGEMQSKLLAKVEELTLYMIEIKKENAALRKEVETLKHTANQ